jgi:cell division protein FtsB
MIAKVKKFKKRKFKLKEEIVFQVIFFGLTSAILVLLAVSNYRINQKRTELKVKIEDLKAEISKLEEEGQELETDISEVQKEVYWEEKVREQGFVKEGENPVVVLPPAEAETEQKTEEKSFTDKLLESIKNLFSGFDFFR